MAPKATGNFTDFDYRSHDQFLRGISTFINMETDLGLYKLDCAYGSLEMGFVGIHILSADLQEAYNGKKYILRCYYETKKIFEHTLGKKKWF